MSLYPNKHRTLGTERNRLYPRKKRNPILKAGDYSKTLSSPKFESCLDGHPQLKIPNTGKKTQHLSGKETQPRMSVFSNLPHDLIRTIVMEADGGEYTHKKKFQATLDNLNHGGDAITHYGTNAKGQPFPVFLHEWGQGDETGLYGYDEDEDDDEEWMLRANLLFGDTFGLGENDHYDDSVWDDDFTGYFYCVEDTNRKVDIHEGLSLDRAKQVASSTGFKIRRYNVVDGEFEDNTNLTQSLRLAEQFVHR